MEDRTGHVRHRVLVCVRNHCGSRISPESRSKRVPGYGGQARVHHEQAEADFRLFSSLAHRGRIAFWDGPEHHRSDARISIVQEVFRFVQTYPKRSR